jgi:hypothetical protein
VRLPALVYRLSLALGGLALITGTAGYLLGSVHDAPAVMTGSARGTALVLATVAVPALLVAMALAARGSTRAVIVWFGTAMYLAYNALLLLLGTPLNRLFLCYVTMLSLSVASAITLAVTAGPARLAARCRSSLPARALAAYLGVIVALNALAWLARIVPALVADEPGRLTEGTGVTMSPTYLQDLALWLPLFGVAAVWLWRRLAWGYLLAGGALTMWAIEALTVAADQWFGHRADPDSPIASGAAVLPFLAAGAIGVAALVIFLHHVEPATTRSRPPHDGEPHPLPATTPTDPTIQRTQTRARSIR